MREIFVSGSNFFALKDFPNYYINIQGQVLSCKNNPTILKAKLGNSGYLHVYLYKDKKHHTKRIHKLMAYTFLGHKKLDSLIVNHKDGNKLNNHILNLELVTPSENNIHASKIGLLPKGESHSFSKLTEKQVIEIRQSSLSTVQLSKIYGVKHQAISKIRLRQRWKHI